MKNALTPPNPVIQPLPSNDLNAVRVIFFLRMPIVLRQLSALTNCSLLLMVVDQTGRGEVDERLYEVPPNSWVSHFNEHSRQTSDSQLASNDEFLLISFSKGANYSHIKNRFQIYYPDDLNLVPAWKMDNKWLLSKSNSEEKSKCIFCKELKEKSIQCLLLLPREDDTTRENKILCLQNYTPA